METERKLMLKYLGERFIFFRKEKGFSRVEAATLLGISTRTLASYERGEREITIDTAKKMAATYCVSFECLTDYRYIHTKIKDYIDAEENGRDRVLL